MGKSLTAEKSFGFAIRIVRLYKILYERKEFVLSKQMLRSGTAIGALLKEAEHAQSKADFISKVNIALKEANETEYWIMLLKETDYLSEKELQVLNLLVAQFLDFAELQALEEHPMTMQDWIEELDRQLLGNRRELLTDKVRFHTNKL